MAFILTEIIRYQLYGATSERFFLTIKLNQTSMPKTNKSTGKFIIAYDTICEGWQCLADENEEPVLFNSYDEAFKTLFDDAHSLLSNKSVEELKEYHEGVTLELISEMGRVLDSNDIQAMKTFLNENPHCNDNEDCIVPAEEFVLGRKTIFNIKKPK